MPPTIFAAAAAFRAGTLTPQELLSQCLERIDRMEDKVRAWVMVDRDGAKADAERLAAELKAGHDRGPLHGIPVAIKDIIDVHDWPTACGSKRWKDAHARHDATVVRKLRQAGAVILGKTVTTLFASFDPPVTRNPWKLGRTPGGSSSGSAAAVACGMCLGALGSQTGGSITRPASYCGVASCKPTYGRASVHGVLPLASSMDHIGPMARTVREVGLLMQTIAGPDPLDPTAAARPVPSMTSVAPRPPRLGRLRGHFEERADTVVRARTDAVLDVLRANGAGVTEVTLPASFGEVIRRHRTVMAVEAAHYHEARLRRHPEDYGPNIRSLLEEGLKSSTTDYARAKEEQRRLAHEMAACLEDVDALVCPATTTPAPDAATTGDPAFNSPWSFTGLPVVGFPIGKDTDGLPVGLQLVGGAWSESELFATAAWCEAALAVDLGEPPCA